MPYKNPLKRRSYAQKRSARLYAERKAAGICVDCGKEPARENRLHCAECGAKRSKRMAEKLARLRKGWRAFGVCLLCGTREAMPKMTYCGVCSERQLEGKKKNVG